MKKYKKEKQNKLINNEVLLLTEFKKFQYNHYLTKITKMQIIKRYLNVIMLECCDESFEQYYYSSVEYRFYLKKDFIKYISLFNEGISLKQLFDFNPNFNKVFNELLQLDNIGFDSDKQLVSLS